jgi:hypothetical protein
VFEKLPPSRNADESDWLDMVVDVTIIDSRTVLGWPPIMLVTETRRSAFVGLIRYELKEIELRYPEDVVVNICA